MAETLCFTRPTPVPDPHPSTSERWETFQSINGARRAVRDFDGGPIADADVRALLEEALLAPSSGNTQPYEIHWVRDPELRSRVAQACEGQRAASSASTLLVFAAGAAIGRRTCEAQLDSLESVVLSEKSKEYHRRQLRKFLGFLRIAPLAVWTPLRVLLALVWPSLTLLPVGPSGLRHWVARSTLYAAQTLLLGASARGLDSCPMEGFSARKVAKLLGLPRGTVIPIVVALGRRRADARIEPRSRRPFEDAVRIH